MRSCILPLVPFLLVAGCSHAPQQGSDGATIDVRARAAERQAPGDEERQELQVDESRDPRARLRARARRIEDRLDRLAARLPDDGREARADLASGLREIRARLERLQERMDELERIQRDDPRVDLERQWDGIFVEVLDLLDALDAVEAQLERA